MSSYSQPACRWHTGPPLLLIRCKIFPGNSLQPGSELFCPDWESPFALDNVWKIARTIYRYRRRRRRQIWRGHDNVGLGDPPDTKDEVEHEIYFGEANSRRGEIVGESEIVGDSGRGGIPKSGCQAERWSFLGGDRIVRQILTFVIISWIYFH